MIQFLADNIDQLDLALDQLAISDRNFDRFALMLIDNVVELTLHKYAQDKAAENDGWRSIEEPKYDPKLIERALGQNFDAKVKIAAKLGLISDVVCESILNLHSFRNTAYHQGLRHEKILHSLAVFYFRNACLLLKAYKPRWWSWGGADKISHRATKYIGEATFLVQEEVFEAAYQRLDDVSATLEEDLVADLTLDMFETIDSVDSNITFLSENAQTQQSRDEAIVDSQAWPFAFTDAAKEFAKENGCPEVAVGPYVAWLASHYDWPLKKDPIPSWHTRLDALRKEKDYHKALKRYCDFMRQTEDVRSKISESAQQLDGYIQQQIDIARGK